jgi:DNA-binding PadR family transcriptional regulator
VVQTAIVNIHIKLNQMSRVVKTMPIYYELPQKIKERWWTEKQCLTHSTKHLQSKEDRWNNLYKNKWIKTREMLIHTEDYEVHLRSGSKKWFYGHRFQVQVFFSATDFKKMVSKNFYKKNEKEKLTHIKKDNTESKKNLQEILNDKRVYEFKEVMMPVKYGNVTYESFMLDKETSFRLYYVLFGLRQPMQRFFYKNYGYTQKFLDLLSYIAMIGFASEIEIYNFNSRNPQRTYEMLGKLKKEGFIEKVTQRGEGLVKLKKRIKLTKLTDKGLKLFQFYVECMTFQRKMPYHGTSITDSRITYKDIEKRDGKFNSDAETYLFYEYIFDYINVTCKTKMISELELREFMEHNQTMFAYNPYSYMLTCINYTTHNGDVSNKTMKDFVARYKLGYDLV